jgi:hypothetical protein
MAEQVVRDGLTPVRFTGDLLAQVSTETNVQPRWIEIQLFKVTEGDRTGSYVLHTVGRSVVYHVHDSASCNTGVPTPYNRLGDDAEPCPKCRPASIYNADGGTVVDMESDRHSMYVCPQIADVVRQFKSWPGGGGKLSAPAERLLEIAGQADPAVAEAAQETETL